MTGYTRSEWHRISNRSGETGGTRRAAMPIQPLIPDLDFIRNKKAWGSAFRFGLLEIGKEDFEQITGQFTTSVPVEG